MRLGALAGIFSLLVGSAVCFFGGGGGQFAADRVTPVEIDGKRFMSYLESICELGPRVSGTTAMTKQQELITAHFEKLKLKVTRQEFAGKQVSKADPVPMVNLIVSVNPDKKKRAIICSHYDTRPLADQEPDPRKWREPFVSANDGGSGVAFMMEFANHLADMKLEVGLDFVIFDGEEYLFDREKDKYFLGSEHFAKTWKAAAERPNYVGAVLLDMIAGKNPAFPAEDHSFTRSKALCTEIWQLGEELKCRAFRNRIGPSVMDDHLALQEVGIPAIDIIDFDYPSWHRLADRPSNCDPSGPTQVGKVLSVWLQRMR
jgi:glutaminyl-peptide cyclotransferase